MLEKSAKRTKLTFLTRRFRQDINEGKEVGKILGKKTENYSGICFSLKKQFLEL